jgi:uncharacterized protein (DUF2141 family)
MCKKVRGSGVSLESLESRRLLAGVTTTLTLLDSNGTPLTQSGANSWNIQLGTTFRVVLNATVTSPNMTNASRSDASLRNLPLGIENLTTDIISSGTQIVDPVADTSNSPPRWVGFTDLTPDSVAYSFTNLVDRGGDGDLDVANTGMAILSFSIPSTGALPKFQYGAAASGVGAPPMQIVLGEYKATGIGTTSLSTQMNTVNVFADTDPDVAVTAVSALANSVNGSITINVAAAPASVSGRVFNDKNANGIFDGVDTGISGFRVFLDKDNDGVLDSNEQSTPVSSTGTYHLTGVPAGTYRVREVFRSGWRQTFPALGYYQVTLRPGDVAKTLSFANTDTVLIKGRVFMDANVNGKLDSGEGGLPNWRLYLDKDNDGIFDSNETNTLSDANGNYRFFNIPAGTYIVRIVQQSGYKQTAPSGKAFTITLAAAGTTSNKNFGEKRVK